MRSHKFKVKRRGFPKRIYKINWLLTFELAGKLDDQGLETEYNLEDLDVCVPDNGQDTQESGPQRSDRPPVGALPSNSYILVLVA